MTQPIPPDPTELIAPAIRRLRRLVRRTLAELPSGAAIQFGTAARKLVRAETSIASRARAGLTITPAQVLAAMDPAAPVRLDQITARLAPGRADKLFEGRVRTVLHVLDHRGLVVRRRSPIPIHPTRPKMRVLYQLTPAGQAALLSGASRE